MGVFERYLTVWVGLGILAGVGLGLLVPEAFGLIAGLEWARVNLVVAVFIWVMIYPMMIQIDWHAVKDVGKKPQGLILTLVVNWLIKPFTMAALGVSCCRCRPGWRRGACWSSARRSRWVRSSAA
ncbi:arsenic resistance protein [Thauera sp. AutoDN2]|uniref:arsenic resistance protein n=1 Tax=Thauera sp. AutoDN2 TaxID=3416051 RepID=UPI003F4B942A